MDSTDSNCGICCFGIKELINTDDGHYTHQSLCQLGKLEKFRENGVEIIDAVDLSGNEFTVLKDFYCSWGRNESWATEHKGQELIAAVNKECEINYQWILYDDSNEEALLNTLQEISHQTILPKRVVVIRPINSDVKPEKVMKWLNQRFTRWTVENLTEELHFEDAVDIAVGQNNYEYYFISKTSNKIRPDISVKINEVINNDMKVFGILYYNNIRIVPTTVHRHFQGSSFGISLEEKIKSECSDKIFYLP